MNEMKFNPVRYVVCRKGKYYWLPKTKSGMRAVGLRVVTLRGELDQVVTLGAVACDLELDRVRNEQPGSEVAGLGPYKSRTWRRTPSAGAAMAVPGEERA